MPIEDLAEGLIRVVGRILVQFFYEIIFELLIKGAGFLVLKPFDRKNRLDPDGALVIITGIIVWIIIGFLAYLFFEYEIYDSVFKSSEAELIQ